MRGIFIMKKTHGFHSLLLCVFFTGTFLAAGCPNPSDGTQGAPGTSGASGPTVLTGTITGTALQTLVNQGTSILIGGAVQVQEAVVDLKSAHITVDGPLSFTGNSIVNAVNADITVGGGSITTNINSVILVPALEPSWAGKAANATLVPLVSVEELIRGNGVNYTLQSLQIDSAGKISGTEISRALGGKKVYVIGELKNDYASLDLSREHSNIVVLGSISSGADIKVGSAFLSGDLSTTGMANLTAVRAVTIGGSLSTGTGAVVVDAPFTVKGTASVGGVFKFADTVLFEGDASFADNITRAGGGTLGFEGNVTIASGKKITLPLTVTLAAGKSINGALAADTPVTLTPALNASLSVDASDSKKLSFEKAGCTLGKGTLAIAPGAAIALEESFRVSPGAAIANNGSVSIAKSLILPASGSISGTGTVNAGKTTISGAWEVKGSRGTVTITNANGLGATITSAYGAGLRAAAAGALITQTAGAGNVLTIGTATTIALGGDGTTALGSIVLKGASSDPGKLTFTANGFGATGNSLITTDAAATTAINGVTKIAGNTGAGKGIAGNFDISGTAKFSRLGASAPSNSISGGGTDTVLNGGVYPAGSFGN
jgi:hypothetical protein